MKSAFVKWLIETRLYKVNTKPSFNSSALLFFSLREEVAKFLTDYCCSPNPLKADNVSEECRHNVLQNVKDITNLNEFHSFILLHLL